MIFRKIIMFMLLFSVPLLGQNVRGIAAKVLEGTVSIYMKDKSNQLKSLASGVIIGDGLILTNFHVIDGAYSGLIKLQNKTEYEISGYLGIDKENDLALLKVPGLKFTGLQFSLSRPVIGDNIYVAGNPQGLSGTFSDGIISSIRMIEGKSLIQITAPISPGSSGGPVVNKAGEIIGIAVGAYANGQNLNFAVPGDIAQKLISSEASLTSISTLYKHSTLNQKSFEVQGIQLRNLVWGDDRYASDQNYTQLKEFSIKNNTQNTIGRVHIIMLVYDKTKTMVDFIEAYFENDLHYDRVEIPPNMAKTFNAKASTDAKLGIYGGPPFRRRRGYYYEIRILDYEIIKK